MRHARSRFNSGGVPSFPVSAPHVKGYCGERETIDITRGVWWEITKYLILMRIVSIFLVACLIDFLVYAIHGNYFEDQHRG